MKHALLFCFCFLSFFSFFSAVESRIRDSTGKVVVVDRRKEAQIEWQWLLVGGRDVPIVDNGERGAAVAVAILVIGEDAGGDGSLAHNRMWVLDWIGSGSADRQNPLKDFIVLLGLLDIGHCSGRRSRGESGHCGTALLTIFYKKIRGYPSPEWE